MTEHIPEFLVGATNVYRTRGYIVKQCVAFSYDEVYGTYLMSRDTYYRCTPKRDREFEAAFADRKNVNGKRIPTAMTQESTSTDRGVTERKEHQGETYAVLRRIRVATHRKTSHRTAVRKIKRSLPYYNLIAGLPA